MVIAYVYLAVLGVASVVTLVMYGWDKRQSGRQGWRVSEASLHLAELLGGWPGGIVGRHVLRHKSKKLSFRVVSWLIVAVHVTAIGVWLWFRYR